MTRKLPLSVALFGLSVLAACKPGVDESAHAAVAAPKVRTGTVAKAEHAPSVEITGSFDPVASVQLGFDVPGRLDELLVSRGDTVRKGDPIARLDDAMARSQVAQAEAGLKAAQAGADAMHESWDRMEKMGDGVSAQQRTETKAKVDAADAQLAQAQAAVQLARTNLAWHTLRAPIDGVITGGPDNVGIMVGAGTPMFVIEDLSALRLKGTAPEEDAWLVAGLDATVLPGTPGATDGISAKVERVLPSLDPATRRIPVEIRVDSPPPQLRAHTFARATVTGAEPVAAWSVPKGAVVSAPQFAVWVLPSPDAPPQKVAVSILEEAPDHLVVAGDLSEGETVAVDPPHGFGE